VPAWGKPGEYFYQKMAAGFGEAEALTNRIEDKGTAPAPPARSLSTVSACVCLCVCSRSSCWNGVSHGTELGEMYAENKRGREAEHE